MVIQTTSPMTEREKMFNEQFVRPQFSSWENVLHEAGTQNLGWEAAMAITKKAGGLVDKVQGKRELTKEELLQKYDIESADGLTQRQAELIQWRRQGDAEYLAKTRRIHASQRFGTGMQLAVGFAGGMTDIATLAGAAAIDWFATKGAATTSLLGLRAATAGAAALKMARVSSSLSRMTGVVKAASRVSALAASGGVAGYLNGRGVEYIRDDFGLEYDDDNTSIAIGMGVLGGALVGMGVAGRGYYKDKLKAKNSFDSMLSGKRPNETITEAAIRNIETPPAITYDIMDKPGVIIPEVGYEHIKKPGVIIPEVGYEHIKKPGVIIPEVEYRHMKRPAVMDGVSYAAFNEAPGRLNVDAQMSYGKSYGKGLMLTNNSSKAKAAASHALQANDGYIVKVDFGDAKLQDASLNLKSELMDDIWDGVRKKEGTESIAKFWETEAKTINDLTELADLLGTKELKNSMLESITTVMRREGFDGYSIIKDDAVDTFLFDPDKAHIIRDHPDDMGIETVHRNTEPPEIKGVAKDFNDYLNDTMSDILISPSEVDGILNQINEIPVTDVVSRAKAASREYVVLSDAYDELKSFKAEIDAGDIKGYEEAAKAADKFLSDHKKKFNEEQVRKTIQDLSSCVLGV